MRVRRAPRLPCPLAMPLLPLPLLLLLLLLPPPLPLAARLQQVERLKQPAQMGSQKGAVGERAASLGFRAGEGRWRPQA